MNESTDPLKKEADKKTENLIRPQSFRDFPGQTNIKKNLQVAIDAAKARGEALEHTLFVGPPGLGKTTLANIVSKEMGVKFFSTSGPVLDKAGDLAGILTNLSFKDIIFIDEIHRMNRIVEEYLYSAMEDYALDIVIDSGPAARTIKINLKPFTLIGATTRTGLLTPPLRARFGMTYRLDYYDIPDLTAIVQRSSSILGIEIEKKAAEEIARRSRGTPRISNRLLRRVRDWTQVSDETVITLERACQALDNHGIDSFGFEKMDRDIIEIIIKKFEGGPVGLSTLALALAESEDTIEEVYEPYLIKKGMIKRTPKGRVATSNAYSYIGVRDERKEKGIFDEG